MITRCLFTCFVFTTLIQLKDASIDAKYDVIIVGGGMAGLSAAEYLVKNGVTNIVVLEATGRLGGRIHTEYINSGSMEMGAQWIHGASMVNNIYNLANLHSLIRNEKCTKMDMTVIGKEGELIDPEFYKKFTNSLSEYEHTNKVTKRSTSVEEFWEKAFETITANYSSYEKSNARLIFNTEKTSRMFYEGDELTLISAVSDYKEIPCNLDINGGNDQLIKILSHTVTGDRIRLNHEVTNIRLDEKEVVVTVESYDKSMKFIADRVIITVSLGVLKNQSNSLFTPKLPQRKLDAMNRLNIGRGVKIFLYYDKPFWRSKHGQAFLFAIDDEMYAKGRSEWINRIYALWELPDNANVLGTVVFGDSAKYAELEENEEIGRNIISLLRNYTEDQTIPFPDKVYKSQWIHSKFTLGTYSYQTLNAIGDERNILTEPLPENGVPRLLFAGEATAGKISSTMHGARHSGIREAMRVIREMKI